LGRQAQTSESVAVVELQEASASVEEVPSVDPAPVVVPVLEADLEEVDQASLEELPVVASHLEAEVASPFFLPEDCLHVDLDPVQSFLHLEVLAAAA
jgi:hypothetical protein